MPSCKHASDKDFCPYQNQIAGYSVQIGEGKTNVKVLKKNSTFHLALKKRSDS